MSKQVLFIGDLDEDLSEYTSFAAKYECIKYTLTTREALVRDFQTRLSNVEAIYCAWLGFHLLGGFNKELVDFAPKTLKVVTTCAVGHDGYDGKYMREKKNITLCNTPSLGADYVADLALYLTISCFRMPQKFEKALRQQGATIDARTELQGTNSSFAFGHRVAGGTIASPNGKNAVVVGFGNIGKRVCKRLHAMGMKLHCVKRTNIKPTGLSFPVSVYTSLRDVAHLAELVVLCLPGGKETENMLNREIIDLMPHGSKVVNVGRGSIINEKDLLSGLTSGKIGAAALDVFPTEPYVNPELLERDNVILTPHIGSSTVENFNDTAVFCLNNIDMILSGKEAQSCVN